MKALIIDDEVDICFLLSSILKKIDIETNYVNSITSGLNALEEVNPQIVFLDNHLPDGMGVEYIEKIKTEHPAVKLVMISSYDTYADKTYAASKGVDYFISKPFSRDTIYQTIGNIRS